MSALPLPDLSQCADEPIRTPGAIQPHGRLVVLTADTGRLVAYSANWPSDAAAREALSMLPVDSLRLQPGSGPAWLGSLPLEGRTWDAAAHRQGDHVLVEYEPGGPAASMVAPIYSVARDLLPVLQQAESVAALCETVAREMKRLTGFGRCLIYRFDSDGHGEVLAERADPGYHSYAGHRFPASDVPAQARELYRVNHIRLIPDADYDPVPLLPAADGPEPANLDLSFAALRSVSPVHLEYMRNMGTLASMSVSIVVGGRLWGLISCHNREPRHLPFQTRVACEHLGRLLSLQIQAQEDNAEVAQRLALHQRVLTLVALMAETDGTLQRLTDPELAIDRLTGATGAAVVLNDSCWTIGETPPQDDIRKLAHWIVARGEDLFATDRLPEVYPEGEALLPACAGVLAISISQVHRHCVLWFRPELIQTIRWAGDPRKTLPAHGRIHPRQSFESWQERVRGRSAPWLPAQQAAVSELRQALIALVLRRAEEMAGHAVELGRVNKELEAFSYTVSHDLRAPMRHIAGYVDLVLEDNADKLDDRARRYLRHVKDAASYAGQLVDALLDFSRLGRSGLRPSAVDSAVLVEDLVEELRQQERGRAIEWDVAGKLPMLWADPLLLQVAVRNLLGNAVKYTRGRAPARIRVTAVSLPEGDGLEISDNGVGFPMKYVGKLFGVFQRLHRTEDFDGTGIGLANVKRIVERHGGNVWARGEPDRGATFGFVLPPRPKNNEGAAGARPEESA
ncbi:GAF domain-containing protein [Ramlibacter sp. USB13]|uniref:histidine kinase n=1 Tax=Ramlibacter cellulosilyticus TaxID=2764187 RepID=A0A923MQG0_9BURK|nr:ATP-binding protein [Ramlibacter cellulosilyticus]MBC5783590.1 GAF domain-containing protein [Ramlibacter cellulosilyticus]